MIEVICSLMPVIVVVRASQMWLLVVLFSPDLLKEIDVMEEIFPSPVHCFPLLLIYRQVTNKRKNLNKVSL